ncbi:MAG: FAD-binding oxidoreductase [Nitriliruptorales bacterium]|nr:FAD-binding oxidoreductase [Nitriliruptorales bacterium]
MGQHELAGQISGAVLEPGDDGYDEARHTWNGRFDRRPDVIARCADADDVSAAVSWAVENGVRISVKGGGHSYAGNTVADEGLLIDLGAMNEVQVDPGARTAQAGAGATWRELDAATQEHGLATTGVTASSAGIAGSTLGGGSGYLSRAYGHALDNVLAVDLVTATGEQVRASEDENPELFWAVRGAGANFGVVTRFEFQLHEVGPQVLAGQIIYPFDDAAEHLRSFRTFIDDAPDGFQCFPFTFRIPPIEDFPEELHGDPVLDFVVFHEDPEAVEVVAPLRDLGDPILDAVAPAPYTAVQQAFDANLPADQRYYSKAHDLSALSDGAIDTFTDWVPRMQGPFTIAYLEPRGGQAGRIDNGATAAGGRDAAYSFHVLAGWAEEDNDAEVMGWARDFHAAMAPYSTGGVYVNLIADDEPDRVPSAFSDVDRLRQLKAEWDPDNVFRSNHNIAPA